MSTRIPSLIERKPSKAIRAMIAGLRMPHEERGFVIRMGTYGRRGDEVCYGCAATAALTVLTKKPVHESFLPIFADGLADLCGRLTAPGAPLEHFRLNDVYLFEDAIDDARNGTLASLFFYCGVVVTDSRQLSRYERLIVPLNTDDYQAELYRYETLADKLEEDGL